MPDTWLIADHHLFHERILSFKNEDGLLLRPEFDNVESMNRTILENHNSVVQSNDEVWFLGDVLWQYDTEAMSLLSRFKGRLNLCVGNHDRIKKIAHHFEKVVLWWNFEEGGMKFRASHVPLLEDDLRRFKHNIHGHLHEKDVLTASGSVDSRYLNVGVEKMGYFPINLEEIRDLTGWD